MHPPAVLGTGWRRVPVQSAEGGVSVVALPAWAREYEGRWIWEHTGWPVDEPGRIVDPPRRFSPAPGLRWEIAAWLDMAREGKGPASTPWWTRSPTGAA
ncbi:hypothetical protein [Streptomyces lavendulocolor]|uniref:hypothetical protein n=1 Tax=Streptomyces lavendulocolor TaxID=67316 RepID=UPI003C2C8432